MRKKTFLSNTALFGWCRPAARPDENHVVSPVVGTKEAIRAHDAILVGPAVLAPESDITLEPPEGK